MEHLGQLLLARDDMPERYLQLLSRHGRRFLFLGRRCG
uniref:Uncharacterized protein n=1 Tax=Arundo donax TaxID=35708 RepID=A0A0A9ELR2_ARUDO